MTTTHRATEIVQLMPKHWKIKLNSQTPCKYMGLGTKKNSLAKLHANPKTSLRLDYNWELTISENKVDEFIVIDPSIMVGIKHPKKNVHLLPG